jgi:hypothetical protein
VVESFGILDPQRWNAWRTLLEAILEPDMSDGKYGFLDNATGLT